MMYKCVHPSPIGALTLASDGINLTGLWIEGQKYHGNDIVKNMTEKESLPIFAQGKNWLARYFNGENPAMAELPLKPHGSAYRQMVWAMLQAIPYGESSTYGALAQNLTAESGRKTAARAVGGAVAHNPISIIIPCNRVLGADGSLVGFAGGVDVKRWLLGHEKGDGSA